MTSRARFLVAVALAAVYAVCYSAIKVGLAYAPPLHYAGLRAATAASVLLTVLAVAGRPLLPPRRLWPGVGAIAATGTLLAFAAMFSAPGRTGAGIASVLGNTAPLFALVLAVPVLGERLTGPKIGALLLGASGAGLIAYPALTDPAHRGSAGALLPLGAAAGFAVSSIIVKRIDARGAELQVAAWQLLLGGTALLAVAAALEPQATIRWTARFAGLLLFLALIGTALATAVWYWLVQRDDVGRLSIALFFVPVAGLGLGVALFREPLARPQVIGVALVLSALAMLVPGGRRPPAAGAPAARLDIYRTMV